MAGGKSVSPDLWRATYIIRTALARGGCTSTAVGERVILTAAHCVRNGALGEISRPDGGTPVLVECDHHEGYAADKLPPQEKNKSKDFALCYVEEPLRGFPFERLATSLADGREGDSIRLLGYGCTEAGQFDPDFGVLFSFQPAIVERQPASGDVDLNTTTRAKGVLCAGDSGGAAYVDKDVNGRRVIIGVNSRAEENVSFFSTTTTEAFFLWARRWMDKKKKQKNTNVHICGLSSAADGCRSN